MTAAVPPPARQVLCATLLAAAFLAASAVPGFAAPPRAGAIPARRATPLGASILDLSRHLDINRLNLFTTNFGHFAWDVATGGPGLVWPRGTDQTAVFASGLWLGCRVGGELRVAVAEYSSEYGGYGMVGGTYDQPDLPQHRTYKVARWTGDPADSARVERSPAELAADPLLDPSLHDGWSAYLAGAAPYGAPTRLYRLPNTATPAPDDSVDVEGPDVLGDQMLWCVYTDAHPLLHTNQAGSTAPLGVEIQQTTFAFARADDLSNILFIRFRILNKGGNTLDDLHVSLWSDPDLGGFTDDLVGCDPARSLGYCYNATNADPIYGATPPAVGYVLLSGPPDPATGSPRGMTAFSKYINGTDPSSAQETFNYMQGLLPGGGVLIDPVSGQPTRYSHPGDPVTVQGWLDSQPADRRMMLSSGPGRMLPGEVRDVWAAIVIGRGSDRLASVTAVRCLADRARSVFAAGLVPPAGPQAPCSPTSVVVNCPKPAVYWELECAAGGAGQLTAQQLAAAAAFVDARSTLFEWSAAPLPSFCATVTPPGTPDLRAQARREYAAFLANYAGSEVDLTIGPGRIWLDPATAIDCPPLRARTLAELAATASLVSGFRDGVYLDLESAHPIPLEGVNWGGAGFGGGAGVGHDFLGSTLDPAADPDSFATVELRFDATATQKAYRYLRLERASDGSAPPQGRGFLYGGHHTVPFTCWDVEHGVQLEVGFVERAVTDDPGTILGPVYQPATHDSTWGPDDSAAGGREYLVVFRRPYRPSPRPELALDGALIDGSLPVLYGLWARRLSSADIIDDGDRFRFVWGLPASPGADSLLIALEGLPLVLPEVQQGYQDLIDCLSEINAGVGIGPTCASGPTPALVALVSAEAVAGRVALRWYSADAGLAASVERRAGDGPWATIGRVVADGGGHLVFDDRDVVAGGRYAYRLAVASGGSVEYLGEAWVVVPADAGLAFFGARTGAPDGRLRVDFSLATHEPARIELVDIAGRRLILRDLVGLPPGHHALTLDESASLPAGLYLVRLSQGGRRVSGKAALVR